jgi:hypothetical protein
MLQMQSLNSPQSRTHSPALGETPVPNASHESPSRRERILAELHKGRNRTPAQIGGETMSFLLHLGAPYWKAWEMSTELGLHAASKPPRSPGAKRRISRRAASEVIKAISDELRRFSNTGSRRAGATTAFQARRAPRRQASSPRRGARRHTTRTRAGPCSDDPDDPEPADLTARSRRQQNKAVVHGD